MFILKSLRPVCTSVGLGLLGWMAAVATVQAQVPSGCELRPVPFREDIRPPDAWEMAWEAAWPDASDALQTWRAGQFERVISVWRGWAPHASTSQAMAERLGLPTSAAYLAWWATAVDASGLPSAPWNEDAMEAMLQTWAEEVSAQSAMAQAHASRSRTIGLDDWAQTMRTGMRLMENLDLPHVHVVQPGETVYSISRAFGLPPRCLAKSNGVWDDLRPGMALIIPDLL